MAGKSGSASSVLLGFGALLLPLLLSVASATQPNETLWQPATITDSMGRQTQLGTKGLSVENAVSGVAPSATASGFSTFRRCLAFFGVCASLAWACSDQIKSLAGLEPKAKAKWVAMSMAPTGRCADAWSAALDCLQDLHNSTVCKIRQLLGLTTDPYTNDGGLSSLLSKKAPTASGSADLGVELSGIESEEPAEDLEGALGSFLASKLHAYSGFDCLKANSNCI